jgi:membrane-bound lytic murein transglycosylase D
MSSVAKQAALAPRLKIIIERPSGERQEFRFQRSVRIGRLEECEVCVKDEHVSRFHAEIAFENGQWWVKDLGSSNGIYVVEQRIQCMPVGQRLTIHLGIRGPEVRLEVEESTPIGRIIPETGSADKSRPEGATIVRYLDHYFGKPVNDGSVGAHTMHVRQAFAYIQTKQKRRYGIVIAALVCAMLLAGSYAFYEYQQARKQKVVAEQLFYTMKSLDLDVANLERLVAQSDSQIGNDEIQKYRKRRQDMERNYDKFLATLHVYNPKMPEQERLVLRIARIFGECELDMPPGFVDEVNKYIKRWQGSGRYAKAIRVAKEKGYTTKISNELLAQGLPPQFFYLAMQESDFDAYTSGPMTRKGYAKGMWQFIPETAVKYGLHLGPLVDLRRPDPSDERDQYEKATKAASRYIKDLYSTDAQASGFLVMACYNWGENQVLPLVRSMPANPTDRNFWKLLSKYRDKIPQETYDYVFYITSAAVIGENPRLYGFDFDNPLGGN